MAKRRLKNKKVRLVAVGAALATGGVVVALLPSANAAEDKTPEEIMNMCNRASVINGVQQEAPGGFAGFLADRCDFIETDFETFNGETDTITPTFTNCEPNATGPTKANSGFVAGVAQGQGRYLVTQQGGGGGLFGALNLSWLKHKATLDMTLASVDYTESEERDVPVGKKLHMDFTPKMQRMTGKWRVEIDALDQGNIAPDIEAQTYEAEEVVEGPVILPGAAGAPGGADGISTPVFTDC